MPCDTTSTARVKLDAKTIDRDVLNNALLSLGIEPRNIANLDNGVITIRGQSTSQALTAKVAQAYSKELVKAQAKRFGWAVKEQADGKLLIQKASF